MRAATLSIILTLLRIVISLDTPLATDCFSKNVTYRGVYANEVEGFIGIRFAEDTGGQNRFKPPVPYTPPSHSTIDANEAGPACPQDVPKVPEFDFGLLNVTEISEDCLALNVWRPNGTKTGDQLPVLVYIYGGSLLDGSKDEGISQPGGMILQSIANGYPIMNVELNYRLGVFGFAQSAAFKQEGFENAGLRDMRLALEWVKANIASFGGDPDRITIHGQSSGGLAVGMQILAYGASRPYPFQQAICQSQALEPGITGNFTYTAQTRVLEAVGCNETSYDSAATVECLRQLPMKNLLNAQLSTASDGPGANIGDQWLPVVDGEGGFLPAAPSQLIHEGRFANVTAMMGWCDNDADIFVSPSLNTSFKTHRFFRHYLPGLLPANLEKLLSLYPESDFSATYFPNGTIQLPAELYRAGRILRDIVFVCQPILLGGALKKAGNEVYYYVQNQTMLTPILESMGEYGYRTVHTSDLLYVFGNLSKFDIEGFPYHPSASDFKLRDQQSRSWSTFAALGKPSLEGHDTLPGWKPADFDDDNYGVYVIGGPNEGYSGLGGSVVAREVMAQEHLKETCEFLNSPEVVRQQHY